MRFLFTAVNVALALSLLAWPPALLLLVFLFDAPGADTSPWTQAAALSILLYPAPVLTGIVGYWRNRKDTLLHKRTRYTLLGLCGPGLIVLLFAGIQVFCAGSLVCS